MARLRRAVRKDSRFLWAAERKMKPMSGGPCFKNGNVFLLDSGTGLDSETMAKNTGKWNFIQPQWPGIIDTLQRRHVVELGRSFCGRFSMGKTPLLLTQTMAGVGTCCYTKQMMPLWFSYGPNNGSLKRVYQFFPLFSTFHLPHSGKSPDGFISDCQRN